MSLLNDMLQDLDYRAGSAPLPADSYALWWPKLVLPLLVLSLFFFCWFLFNGFFSSDKTAEAQPRAEGHSLSLTQAVNAPDKLASHPISQDDKPDPLASAFPLSAETVISTAITPLTEAPLTQAPLTQAQTTKIQANKQVDQPSVVTKQHASALHSAPARLEAGTSLTSTKLAASTAHAGPDNAPEEELNIVLSVQENDDFIFSQANKLLASADSTAAIRYLLTAISQTEPMLKSQLLLIDLSISQDGIELTHSRMQRYEQLDQRLKNYLHAQALIDQQDYPAALDVLQGDVLQENVLPGHQDNLLIHARQSEVKAALYQKVGQYQSAALLYQALLQSKPESSRYWLGLAISYDKLSDNTAALHAYRRAAQTNDLSATVMVFVKQRIHHLLQGVK